MNLGDRIGRVRAMGISILFYSVFAGIGAFVTAAPVLLFGSRFKGEDF